MTIYYANTNIVYQSHPPFSRHVLKHESIRTAALSLHLVHEKLFTTPERGIRPPARSYHLSPPQLRAAEEARDRPEVLWDIYWFWSKAATDVLNLPERDNSTSSPRPGSHDSLSSPVLDPTIREHLQPAPILLSLQFICRSLHSPATTPFLSPNTHLPQHERSVDYRRLVLGLVGRDESALDWLETIDKSQNNTYTTVCIIFFIFKFFLNLNQYFKTAPADD